MKRKEGYTLIKKGDWLKKRVVPMALSASMVLSMVAVLPVEVQAEEPATDDRISNKSLTAEIGDLGQISLLTINNNRTNSYGEDVNFVLPNDTAQQNNEAHQWMGEMIFSYRTSEDGTFPEDNSGFVEVDTNKTLAAGGSTTYSNASENLENNPYIDKSVISDEEVEIVFHGQDLESTDARTMKGFDVTSNYNMETDDGSLLWTITLENTSEEYIEFGDVGLPMPWNNKYATIDDTYNNRVTVHTFAGADSGYAYAIRCSGEGNYMLFTPVVESGARIEYIDQWTGTINGVVGTRSGELYQNWTSDTGGWFPGLSVYYIHSKDIQETGRGYYTDATSLVLAPGESQTYQFKFSAVRAGDNDPQNSAEDYNNASDSVEERENNMRSILYNEGLIDAVAVPGFQTAINMTTKLDLHYDEDLVKDVSVDVQCVHENDPFDAEHIPQQTEGLVNNDKAVECAGVDADSATLLETKVVDGETHHIYELKFGCIGNNSVRVEYTTADGEKKFTQYEFNVLAELDEIINTHADFMVNETQDTDPDSPTYGIYSDWYISTESIDPTQQTHWGDDWSHDNINFMAMKNYLDPDAEEVKSIETYLIDFMWNNYMKYTQDTYTVANYLSGSGIYSDSTSPYTRTFSEVMEATGFFNMYRIVKAYPDLIDYREDAQWYLEKAAGIYLNRVGTGAIGFYGEQQIPDMIEALRTEGMDEEADQLQEQFALKKGTNMAQAQYPYGSEFEYDNTGEEGAYAAAKALREYYPSEEGVAAAALENMEKAEWKTRAMRGIQPTWYQYADPVFRGGESWWNFQYTASLAGYIMDDWLRYEDNGWDTDSSAWAARLNYAAKLSNFNAVNMGQISDKSVGSVSWRYTMSKGGYGAQNVNDGGSRIMNNGWNDFSGESEEGLYGSLLSISADITTDPIFGLYGYGAEVSKDGTRYTINPTDGIGKRINLIDEKVYVELVQDACTTAVMDGNGTYFNLNVNNTTGTQHMLTIELSGAGVTDGYYSIQVNGQASGQCYVTDNHGIAYANIPEGATAQVTIQKMDGGENTAPVIESVEVDENPEALVPFRVESTVYDDGAPDGTLTYKWEVTNAPEGGELTFSANDDPYAEVTANLDGVYTVKLTVSDGALTAEKTVDIQVGKAPEKTAPVIDEISGVQHPTNTTVAELEGSATGDAVYNNELKYQWSVVEQPEGGNAVLANADQPQAMMKAYAPGTYTLRLTVTDPSSTIYDEDVSSYKDVTVEMTGNVDGIERAGTVLTSVGTAPQLPETMTLMDGEGNQAEHTITWDAVSEDSYAQKGEFTVSGVAEDDDSLKVEVNVMVVEGTAQNVALIGIPTAIINTPQDLGGVAGLNDGYDPASSRDTSHGVWHNWLGDQNGTAWVQYTWDSEVTIYQSNAYYYTDGNFVPAEVWYEYLDANGEWRPVVNAQGCGNALNQYNVTTFDPVTTTAIRMWMNPKTKGCGVIEWQVMGYADGVVDKVQLRRVVDQANGLNLDLFDLTEQELADFEALVAQAEELLDNREATQEQVDAMSGQLAAAIAALPTADGNVAYSASVSTSYVSGWEKVEAVNDGKIPDSSYNPAGPRYGSWGNSSAYETVTYTWNAPITLTGADIYFWYDGTEGDPTSGGIQVPREYYYEYLDSDGNWQKVENPSAYTTNMDGYNNTTFDPVSTTSIRITMMKQNNDGNGVGIMEWKVYSEQTEPQLPTLDDLKELIAQVEGEDESLYTAESWEAFQQALTAAQAVVDKGSQDGEEIQKAMNDLRTAWKGLEQKPAESGNIALDATAGGICDYVNDLGGLATLNDGKEPANSNDKTNGTWHNWNHRYDGDGNIQNAWLTYTWDQPMVLDSTSVYYFTDGGGIRMPQSVTFQYLDENGQWVDLTGVTPGCEANQYNTTNLGGIVTTALRMEMEPQFNVAGDPASGVGVIEWQVNGSVYVEEPETADKTQLEALINEVLALNEADYTAESWAALQTALADAQAVMANDTATQTEVDTAYQALADAKGALEDKPVVKDALNAAIAEAEKLQEEDYTAETWAAFARALENAKAVAENEKATQAEVDAATAALNEAKGALEQVEQPPVDQADKTQLKALLDEVGAYAQVDYTAETWAVFAQALQDAYLVYQDTNATQAQVDQARDALQAAADGLEKVRVDVDLSQLRQLIAQAQGLKEEDYTAESWAMLQDVLQDAIEAANQLDVTQDVVDALADSLQDAMNRLDKVTDTDDDSQTGDQEDEPITDTGDQNSLTLYVVILLVAATMCVGAVVLRRKLRF